MNLEVDGTERLPLVTQLLYEEQDPYAIRVCFELQEDVAVTWTIERDLLDRGLTQEVGDGDVRIAPRVDADRREARIELAGCGLDGVWGRAVFFAWEPALRGFLDRTYEAVPPGAEEVDVDAFLTEVLTAG
ncbi:SsgA family sporulation/cell division regulator [Streptomyces sp. NPDC001691]|uniref:SsgA family sporulation/cell division regulator n=1 Tax=unclassified Streptomyces TaxID=2593676 RepID=UPI0011C0708E|nr:SsgA family sporulation/cell division regulator [Streptomyces sp. SDr-06]